MTKVKGKTLPKVRVKGRVLDRVEGSVMADALGAKRTRTKRSVRQGPVALFALRQALAERLRSTGGRPSLGASRRQKIPLDDADWELLWRIAELLSEEGRNPTPGQVASELLRQRLHQVREEMEKSDPDELRRELGMDEDQQATG